MKKKAAFLQQRGGNSEAVGGDMKHESGRMNFIQEKEISINIPSCKYSAIYLFFFMHKKDAHHGYCYEH